MLRHTLIAGDTGSGKSYFENMLVKKLLRESCQMILIDPKMLELSEYSDKCIEYADNPDAISTAIRHAYNQMEIRIKMCKEKHLKEFKGVPLYLVIDEILPITSNKDFIKDGTVHYIEQIAILGRAAKVFLIICSQSATRKSIPALVKTSCDTIICMRQHDKRDYNYVLDTPVKPLTNRYGECYLRMCGMVQPEKRPVDEKLLKEVCEDD